MSEIICKSSLIASLSVPSPKETIGIREANHADLTWMDELQKKFPKQLGFMPKSWLEGKLKANQILVGEISGERIGYIIAQDRYLKRDELGIVYQLVVSPGKQRSFIGAALLKAQFDRSQYGCRLYCCWCAQDLDANHFWEAMGFYPLAYRNGSETKGKDGKPRVQIFWEKKIRGKEDSVNWWFPAKTEGGAMLADRLALPIPPGVHWSEVEPIEIPLIGEDRMIEGPTEKKPRVVKPKVTTERQPLTGGLRFALPKPLEAEVVVEKVKKPRAPKIKKKIDPQFIKVSKELRDKYLEQVNERGYKLESAGKYELTRDQTPALSPRERGKIPLLEAA